MKCVLISIKPKWCELIASGKKTVEVRKTGEFVCDNIYPIRYERDGFYVADFIDCKTSCLKPRDFIVYGKGKPLYGW